MLTRIVHRSPSPAMVISLLALFVAMGGTAYAATGGTFILGHANSANAASSLTSSVATGPALSVTNTGGKPAAKFTTNAASAPFQVNSATKVTNLNADKLDGQDSTGFAPASVATGHAQTVQPSTSSSSFAFGGMISITFDCAEFPFQTGTLNIVNSSGNTENVFVDSGTDNPDYESMSSGSSITFFALPAGDSWVIQAQGPLGILVVEVATVNRVSDCYVQAQGVLTH